ncbi:hypothetical protein JCM1841_001223 [Sporobolomyces salmonicolor]
MSRRDEVVDSIDSLVSSFRQHLSDALAPPDHNGARPTPHQRHSAASALGARLSSVLDLPHPHATASAPSTPAAAAASAPFSGRQHVSVPLATSDSAPALNAGASTGDALPSYSRRAPVPPNHLASLPPKRLHLLASRSGKLHLELEARGRERVVLIQEQPDQDVDLHGRLKAVLKEPEGVTHIKIRLKGIIRTLVMKAHASGRHPVSDEVTFHESAQTLYSSTTFLPDNASTDPDKLQGIFTFPFALSIPARITHLPVPAPSLSSGASSPTALDRPIRPPPSFMLDSLARVTSLNPSDGLGQTRASGLSTGGWEGSVRYFVKVTLGRRGLLKLNERWIIPVVFVPRQAPPPISPGRELALAEGRRPPHSAVDEAGWTERGKYKDRRTVKRGMWKAKSASIQIEGRTIRGHKVERGEKGEVPFEVQITTSNPSVTGRFPPSTVCVYLAQRTTITAQRLTNAQDVLVARALTMHPIGTPSGEAIAVRGAEGRTGWRVEYGGSIKLNQSIPSSFRAPNLSVSYMLCFSLRIGGESNDDTPLAIPIEIVSCVPRERLALALPPLGPPPPPPVASASTSTSAAGATRARPVVPPRPLHEEGKAPRLGEEERDGRTGQEAEEQRRLEDEWGLPPSYFDVVGVDDADEWRGGSRRR